MSFLSRCFSNNDRGNMPDGDDMAEIEAEIARVTSETRKVVEQKRQRLKDLDLFVLDNSIRESTVGQLRSHTLQNKLEILEQVQKVGIKDIIVASFSHMTRVDDDFVQHLKDNSYNFSHFYSFSEVTEGIKPGTNVYDTETLPVSLGKNHKYGIPNTIFEVDLASDEVDWETKFTNDDMCQLIHKWMKWTYKNITKSARILINFRDLPLAMTEAPKRLFYVMRYLCKLSPEERPFALLFEEPTGDFLPEELETWTASVRRTMSSCGWVNGKILVHIHQKWDLQTAGQLDCLSAGADGIWCSLCEEGAAMGHACSSITMMNLIRLGNKKVSEKYNSVHIRNAAIEVTKITTGRLPHPKQVLYGERAVDLVFGEGAMGAGLFDLAEFFGVETPNRISTLATTEMIVEHLEKNFGKNPQFTKDIAKKMKEKMLEDLRDGRKEEYNSPAGVAYLFDSAGGKLTEKMSDVIAKIKVKNKHHQSLIDEVRKQWDFWDQRDAVQNDDRLQFDSFYHGFMQPYFGCYRCPNTKKGLKALDMNLDGYVDWKEFLVFVKWALHQYPDVADVDELMSIVFEKGLVPAMRDERVNQNVYNRSSI
ncbi:uncharacterized protein [Dysidea avara]|uniref:uncharacterized protein n=1 Tax=Dysidea avara TaxID=196820 RepID=UPI003316C633